METVFGSEQTKIRAENLEAAQHQLQEKAINSTTHVEAKET